MVLGVRANNLRDVRYEIAEMLGILVMAGTATAGAAGTISDTNRAVMASADEVKGYWAYIHTGTGIGQERLVSASTAAGVLSIRPNWGTNPSTDSQYIVTKLFRASEIDRAIDEAISFYARRCSLPWESHYLGVNNIFNDPDNVEQVTGQGLIYNWQFDEWDAANAPDDWSLTNANADEENTVQAFAGLRRVLKLQNTASAAGIAQLAVENFYKWGGHKVRPYGVALANNASRVFLRLDDGVATFDSGYHSGDGSWERLDRAWTTLSDNITQLLFQYRTTAAAQITGYFGPAYLLADYDFQEYILPLAFTVVEDVYIEETNFADFGQYDLRPLNHRYWDIREGPQTNVRSREDSGRGQDAIAFPRLVLRTDLFTPPSPARIRIVGRGFPNLIAATATGGVGGPGATTNYENISPVVAPELIKYAAALALNERLPQQAKAVSSAWLKSQVQRAELMYTARLSSKGRRVRSG